jgi:hypothetical protein
MDADELVDYAFPVEISVSYPVTGNDGEAV